jgi:serine/threonine protein kinase
VICPSCQTENPSDRGICEACAGPLRPVAPGTVLAGRYEILSVLGRGGMGTVYAARDRTIDDTVALKVLRPEIAGSAEFTQRFLSEVRLARRVSHPNVCRIHEYGEDGGLRFLVMELVDGRDLTRILRDGPLPKERALEIAIQAAEALSAIHAAGIVHRDLKTANLMIDRAGQVKLMDFGIAKHVGTGTPAAPSGYIVGTPEYMSPEQGRGRTVDARSDIYALGIVAYELHTGHVPFRAETPVGTLLMHVEAEPPLDDPALPPSVAGVLRRALAKDPADRFPTAAAMAEALRALGTTRPLRRKPAPMRSASLALAAVAIAAGLAWMILRATPPGPAPTTPPSLAPSPLVAAAPAESPVMEASPVTVASPPAVRGRPSPPAATPPPAPEPTSATTLPPPITAPAIVAEAPRPAETPTPPPSSGILVTVVPWADLSIDGVPQGQTPLARIEVAPGAHQLVLSHPDYRPWVRKVRVSAGETLRLRVDLRVEGVRRR